MELFRLREQNKWWDSPDALRADLHLRAVAEAHFSISHPAETKINLTQDRLYILRGPRAHPISKVRFGVVSTTIFLPADIHYLSLILLQEAR